MFLSVFDVFKIGIGPSSSHTMGPMTAAGRFLDLLREHPSRAEAAALGATLHGSLAFTGKGHATDRAVALGLLGWTPARFDGDAAERQLAELGRERRLRLAGLPPLAFDPAVDIVSSTTARLCPDTPTGWCSRPGLRMGRSCCPRPITRSAAGSW